MTTQLLIIRIASACLLLSSATISVAKAQDGMSGCEAALAEEMTVSDTSQIVDIVKTVFVAAGADDVAKFDSLIAPGFYLYDGGVRFDGDSIMGLIKRLHAAGARYEWNVTQPDVHVTGSTAWVAHVNRGSVTDSSGSTKPVTWLESAFLQKDGGGWKIVFMHSTRAPAARPAQGQ